MTDFSKDDADKALFRAAVDALSRAKKKPASDNKASYDACNHLSNHYTETVGSETILSHQNQPIPAKRMQELKKGQVPIHARLDLHHFNVDEARLHFYRFIQEQAQDKQGCLLIVHGKGGHRGEAPVLKNHVNTWLQQCPDVLAFHSALNRDGGAGAVYVLLKRKKSIAI